MCTSQSCWYALITKPRDEIRALEHLQAQGFHCFLPQIQREKLSRGRVSCAIEPLFPRYMFIRLDDAKDNFYSVRSTRGVSDFVRFGALPAKVASALIDEIRNRCQLQTAPDASLPQENDAVELLEGPFRGLQAIFQCRDGEQRSILLLKLMQKHVKFSAANREFRKLPTT